jgi:hypothetical protein
LKIETTWLTKAPEQNQTTLRCCISLETQHIAGLDTPGGLLILTRWAVCGALRRQPIDFLPCAKMLGLSLSPFWQNQVPEIRCRNLA